MDLDMDEDLENLSVLVGIDKADDLSFRDAAERCLPLAGMSSDEISAAASAALRKARWTLKRDPNEPLQADEIAAINLFTQETPYYAELNRLMRERNRDGLKPFFSLLKLMLAGLHRLPHNGGHTVHRGVKLDLSSKYAEGHEFCWWSFSSATRKISVLKSPQFCGTTGPRTIFSVAVTRAVDISNYSAIPSEDEILLLPGSVFEVSDLLQMDDGLTIIQVKELDDEPPLLTGFAFA